MGKTTQPGEKERRIIIEPAKEPVKQPQPQREKEKSPERKKVPTK